MESNKPLNQSLQGGLEKISYMSSNGLPGNCCKVPNKHLIVERLLNLWSKLLYNGLWYLDYTDFVLILDILPSFQAHWLNNEIRLYLDLKSFCFSFDFSLGILFFFFFVFCFFFISMVWNVFLIDFKIKFEIYKVFVYLPKWFSIETVFWGIFWLFLIFLSSLIVKPIFKPSLAEILSIFNG